MAMDEVRIANGQAPRGSFDFDQATSVMAPISQDPQSTQALSHTQVMPTTMTPVETLPDYDEEPANKRNYIVGAAVAGLVILGGIIFLITSLGGGNSGLTVPNVKGATCDVAKQQLEALKFSVAFSPAETVCDATAIVASQDPASGDTAKEGEIITLVLPKKLLALRLKGLVLYLQKAPMSSTRHTHLVKLPCRIQRVANNLQRVCP
jgi:hypothetical protein